MNAKRILLAGLVVGLVMNLLDFVTNAVVFGADWEAAYRALGLTESKLIPVFWVSFDFVAGVIMAWLCAAMRPRLGARAGLYAGGVVWLLVHMTLYSHLVDGVFPARVLLGTSAGEAVSALVGGLIVGKLYRDT